MLSLVLPEIGGGKATVKDLEPIAERPDATAIRISASGARYSLTPRRPTVGPSGGAWWHGSGYPTRVNLGNLVVRRKGISCSGFDLESQWLSL